ncbi:hypothetical protein [Mycobacterium sp. SMC-4]|uniref:hypothetical protein n=1 Tax=Mycobacterium sp. SMC-4 TaxID=2857059 RepID=UPI003CFC3743
MRKLLSGMAVLLVVTGCTTQGEPTAVPVELPQQTLLASSMRAQPVAGWTVTVADLGLPPGTTLKPIGSIGSRGLFVGITDDGWWLLGIDVRNGQRTFGPVRLGAVGEAAAFNCYVNGPPDVLCVRQEQELAVPGTAWVIDTDSGEITYEGPTDVKVAWAQDRPRLEPIGDRVVATLENQGLHGVGSRGELTWFVPGDGILPAQFAFWDHDTRRPALAVQGTASGADVVFSTVDGAVITPSLPPDVRLRRAVVYPGGFGYEYSDGGSDFVAFFDETGARRGEPIAAEGLETRSLDVPMVRTPAAYRVMASEGRQLLELPRTDTSPHARLIGSRLFVAQDQANREWQEFDLNTGERGRTCGSRNLGFDYVGTDGVVTVTRGDGILARGVDLTTCDTLWTLPGSQEHVTEVWRVGTTLVQRTDDTLFSLVAPG